jgi:hypothetical protein
MPSSVAHVAFPAIAPGRKGLPYPPVGPPARGF